MIRILATGGTIAGTADAASGGHRYTAAVLPVEHLLKDMPDHAGPSLDAEQVLSLDSKDMTPSDWLILLAAARRALQDPAVDGLVILHGTDTMEETAYFLHLTLPPGKPVILTGAMRPADHPEADGPGNIRDALRLASQPGAARHGVRVCMNGSDFGARQVFKARSKGLDAFSERLVDDASAPHTAKDSAGRFAALPLTSLPRVDILPGYAGAPSALIDFCTSQGARGLVLALTGHGSVPIAWEAALAQAQAAGVTILRASRCDGPVIRNANADDDRRGWLTAGSLPPVKARIALMLALAAGWGLGKMVEELPGL
ncbi:asparaginase [Zoogloea sp.]|uniref:asparaginase n=1 Tax=Zoogloea sp. TaxID=49181 RepID=UPI0014169726|nr:MAG: asparaginase [Zoogloea sp.]